MACNTCCLQCRLGDTFNPSASSPSSKSPWDLDNFLPTGVIPLKTCSQNGFQLQCDHHHSQDGWHTFSSLSLIPSLASPQECGLYEQLEYLSDKDYIRVTVSQNASYVLCRVYLIPFDLPNVQGILRIRNDASNARVYMRNILAHVRSSHSLWEGDLVDDCIPSSGYFFPNPWDTRTLAEIYGDIASPTVNMNLGSVLDYSPVIMSLLDSQNPLSQLGLRSKLYPYQRKSVAAMVFREQSKESIPDPCYVPVTGLNARDFYIQPGTFEVLQEQPRISPPSGGILCEELGTGKTIMMLSLILTNLHAISQPEPSIIDPQPILTPIALNHFPSGEYEQTRSRSKVLPKRRSHPRVPHLTELLVHHIRAHPLPNNLRTGTIHDRMQQTPLSDLILASTPFFLQYSTDSDFTHVRRRSQRAADPGTSRKLFLTSATLIVVPGTLVEQWYREILKHILIDLRVLRLTSDQKMPASQSLATDFDIVLMSYQRFAAEARMADTSKFFSWTSCTCPPYRGTRIPRCTCEIPGLTPLVQIRWKRLVIDEGHVSGTLNSVSTSFCKLLSVQYRWIVTGTPTTNLLGLHFGTHSETEASSQQTSENDVVETYTLSTQFDESNDPDIPRPVWKTQDGDDLQKLGNMVSSFIAVPTFATNPSLMRTHVKEPLMDKTGPRPGAIQVLSQLMSMVMIRHRIEDIEQDILLPPLRHDRVFLDLDAYAALSYNMLMTNIVLNAVDSERTGQDYFFHPNNVNSLAAAIQNMSQVLFWRVDDNLYNLEEEYRNKLKWSENAEQRNIGDEDKVLLRKALDIIDSAHANSIWQEMQYHEDIPFRTSNFGSDEIFSAWSRLPETASTDKFTHPDRLLELRKLVCERPLTSLEMLIEAGVASSRVDRLNRQIWLDQELVNQSKRKKGGGAERSSKTANLNDARTQAGDQKARSAEVRKELRKALGVALERLQEIGSASDTNSGPATSTTPRDDTIMVRKSPVSHLRIRASASSKLNWILKEVLTHSGNEKIIIFSDSELTLAHVSEALDLCRVKFVRFTSAVPLKDRQAMVLTFETSDVYKVLLMSLKHGARGLNVVSASRVIFCEPVWQADVESQAIKRVHRIGQTKPVTVTTLAIRGTAEEAIVERRNSLLSRQSKLPKLIEEAGMRHFIAYPKFLEPMKEQQVSIDFPLFHPPSPRPLPIPNSHGPNRPRTAVSSQSQELEILPRNSPHIHSEGPSTQPIENRPQAKKIRTVRFDDS